METLDCTNYKFKVQMISEQFFKPDYNFRIVVPQEYEGLHY